MSISTDTKKKRVRISFGKSRNRHDMVMYMLIERHR
jgi:hypothetical protein